MSIDARLKDWATPKQVVYIDAVNEHGSVRAAARALKLKSENSIRQSLKALKERAAAHGYSPDHDMTHAVPTPFVVKGMSTLRDAGGNVLLQWEKTKLDDQLWLQAIHDGIATAAADLPALPPRPGPATTFKDLLNLYVFTDYHLGMMAWAPESGVDWDLQKGERLIVDAFRYMIGTAPMAHTGFIAQLGDFLHSDSLDPVTPTSHHVLDQGSRFQEIVESAIRVIRRIVDMALEKHEQVVLLNAEGNHDIASSIWLRAIFRHLYANEPRITVIESEKPYYAYQFGKVMLGFHHGHKVKNEQLPGYFAASERQMWGAVDHVEIHTGHRHHRDEKDHNGATVIQHRTLAPRDAYSTRGGYDQQRETSVITYHARLGRSGRQYVRPEMFDEAA